MFAVVVLVAALVYSMIEREDLVEDNERLQKALYRDFPVKFDALAALIHKTAKRKGFWPSGRNRGETIALIHSEVTEMLEAHRNGFDPLAKDGEVEEAADVVIRVMDYVSGFVPDASLGQAIIDKTLVNVRRPNKHGKSF